MNITFKLHFVNDRMSITMHIKIRILLPTLLNQTEGDNL